MGRKLQYYNPATNLPPTLPEGGWAKISRTGPEGKYIANLFLAGELDVNKPQNPPEIYRNHYEICQKLEPKYFTTLLNDIIADCRIKLARTPPDTKRSRSATGKRSNSARSSRAILWSDQEAGSESSSELSEPESSADDITPAKRKNAVVTKPTNMSGGVHSKPMKHECLLEIQEILDNGPDQQVHFQLEVVELRGGLYLLLADLPGSVNESDLEAFRDQDNHKQLVVRYRKTVLVDHLWAKQSWLAGAWNVLWHFAGRLVGPFLFKVDQSCSYADAIVEHFKTINHGRRIQGAGAAMCTMRINFEQNIKADLATVSLPTGTIPGRAIMTSGGAKIAQICVELESNFDDHINDSYVEDMGNQGTFGSQPGYQGTFGSQPGHQMPNYGHPAGGIGTQGYQGSFHYQGSGNQPVGHGPAGTTMGGGFNANGMGGNSMGGNMGGGNNFSNTNAMGGNSMGGGNSFSNNFSNANAMGGNMGGNNFNNATGNFNGMGPTNGMNGGGMDAGGEMNGGGMDAGGDSTHPRKPSPGRGREPQGQRHYHYHTPQEADSRTRNSNTFRRPPAPGRNNNAPFQAPEETNSNSRPQRTRRHSTTPPRGGRSTRTSTFKTPSPHYPANKFASKEEYDVDSNKFSPHYSNGGSVQAGHFASKVNFEEQQEKDVDQERINFEQRFNTFGRYNDPPEGNNRNMFDHMPRTYEIPIPGDTPFDGETGTGGRGGDDDDDESYESVGNKNTV